MEAKLYNALMLKNKFSVLLNNQDPPAIGVPELSELQIVGDLDPRSICKERKNVFNVCDD